jgi:hypothetical protein
MSRSLTTLAADPERVPPAGSDPSRPDPTHAETESTVSGPTLRTVWRRYRIPVLAIAALLLLAAGIAVVSRRGVRGELDPRAVDDTGSRALATLLVEHGVEVRRITNLTAATEPATGGDVVLIAFPNLLPPAALRPLGDTPAARVILIAPQSAALSAVTDHVRLVGAAPVAARPPGCELDAATAAGVVDLGGLTYRATGDDGTGCYREDGGSALVLARGRGGGELAVLGAGDPLTNGRLGEQGNAALALNLLGADGSADRVHWLVPSPGAAVTNDERLSLSDIVPSWVLPAALQLLVAALLAALWRARRLGPPVAEPLPVVVRAAESVEGRARLYRRAQARDRAADALRAGTLARLVPRLGLDPSAGGEPAPAAVVEAVVQRSGLPGTDVHDALYGPPPADDPALVRLADILDTIVRSTLDSEVRRS